MGVVSNLYKPKGPDLIIDEGISLVCWGCRNGKMLWALHGHTRRYPRLITFDEAKQLYGEDVYLGPWEDD